MRPARTTKKANPVSSGKNNATASSQGRRDAGAVVSKCQCLSFSQTAQVHLIRWASSTGSELLVGILLRLFMARLPGCPTVHFSSLHLFHSQFRRYAPSKLPTEALDRWLRGPELAGVALDPQFDRYQGYGVPVWGSYYVNRLIRRLTILEFLYLSFSSHSGPEKSSWRS